MIELCHPTRELYLTVEVDRYLNRKADLTTWASDWDYRGYKECEYTIMRAEDENGDPVPVGEDMYTDDLETAVIELHEKDLEDASF